MKKLLLALALMGSTTLFAAPASPNNEPGIRIMVRSFINSWNAHDPKAMSSLWLEEGDLIDPWGKWASNRSGVEKIFTEDQNGRFKTSVIEQIVENIRFVTPDVAVIDVTGKITGAKTLDGKVEPPMAHHVVYIVTHKDGKWKIVSARPYMLNNPLMKVKG